MKTREMMDKLESLKDEIADKIDELIEELEDGSLEKYDTERIIDLLRNTNEELWLYI